MQETIEILQDAELMEDIRKGMQAIQNGDTVSLGEARCALGIE
jgi:PHD/YefM family antitoxin component YafN of YafNO toxin-antitoxin module